MSPFVSGALFGAAIGVLVTTYALSKTFRTAVNSRIAGLFAGKEKHPKVPAKEVLKEPPKDVKARLKQHKCPVCGEYGTALDMDEAKLSDSKAVIWIHRHCQNKLEENGDV